MAKKPLNPKTEVPKKEFDFNEFKLLPVTEEGCFEEYAYPRLTCLGLGSSRVVYELPDKKTVLKIAFDSNVRGQAQNEKEATVSKKFDKKYESLFAKVLDHDKDYRWIVMEKAIPLSDKQFIRMLGGMKNLTTWGMAAQYLDDIRLRGGNVDNYDCQKAFENLIKTSDFFKIIADIVRHCDLLAVDLVKDNSWGYVIRDGKKTAVLIDYGISPSDFEEYYIQEIVKELVSETLAT